MAIEGSGRRKECDKTALNNVVLWCCFVFVVLICGYGLYRQHRLEQRVLVLEEQQLVLKRMLVKEDTKDSSKALRRVARDANDCICPPGFNFTASYILVIISVSLVKFYLNSFETVQHLTSRADSSMSTDTLQLPTTPQYPVINSIGILSPSFTVRIATICHHNTIQFVLQYAKTACDTSVLCTTARQNCNALLSDPLAIIAQCIVLERSSTPASGLYSISSYVLCRAVRRYLDP
ncbi:hypothetical protein ACJJTC_002706 [Scirpophaga incertulas]